jgi:hypothetical protein
MITQTTEFDKVFYWFFSEETYPVANTKRHFFRFKCGLDILLRGVFQDDSVKFNEEYGEYDYSSGEQEILFTDSDGYLYCIYDGSKFENVEQFKVFLLEKLKDTCADVLTAHQRMAITKILNKE